MSQHGCEACGTRAVGGASLKMTQVRTANGSLFLCPQCLNDINRKNPAVAELATALGNLVETCEELGFADDTRVRAMKLLAAKHKKPR